jgi:hypothetical protein
MPMVAYQREVWSQAEVAGYNELVDMTAVEQIKGSFARGVEGGACLFV